MPTKTKKTVVEAEVEPKMEQAEAVVDKAETKAKKAAKVAATKVEEVIEETADGSRRLLKVQFPKPVRTVYLAGLGAVSMAQDETETVFHKLVEQGTEAEKEGRQWLTRMMKRQRKQTEKAADEVEVRVEGYTDRLEETVEKMLNRLNIPTKDRVEHTVETALAKLNVPTKNDIDRLSAKIAELSEKVDSLKAVNNGHKVEA